MFGVWRNALKSRGCLQRPGAPWCLMVLRAPGTSLKTRGWAIALKCMSQCWFYRRKLLENKIFKLILFWWSTKKVNFSRHVCEWIIHWKKIFKVATKVTWDLLVFTKKKKWFVTVTGNKWWLSPYHGPQAASLVTSPFSACPVHRESSNSPSRLCQRRLTHI